MIEDQLEQEHLVRTYGVRTRLNVLFINITARGNRRESIFDDDIDRERERFLEIFRQVIEDFNWVYHAYCLMNNHYHLVIETPDSNLSKGMRQLNSLFTQASNHRHQHRNVLECGHRPMSNCRRCPVRQNIACPKSINSPWCVWSKHIATKNQHTMPQFPPPTNAENKPLD